MKFENIRNKYNYEKLFQIYKLVKPNEIGRIRSMKKEN